MPNEGWEEPAWPDPGAPSGCVWPLHEGRARIREIMASGPPSPRLDRVGQRGTHDGSGGTEVRLYELDGWALKTSVKRRYPDVATASEQLRELVVRKRRLGPMLPDRTVLCCAGGEGGWWLWTVSPWLTTCRGALDEAAARSDDEALARELLRFARAALASVDLFEREGLVLDVHPSNFGQEGGRLVYVDDDIEVGGGLLTLGHTLLQRTREYGGHPAAVARYVEGVADLLADRWPDAPSTRASLRRSIAVCPPLGEVPAEAQRRWLEALDREPTAPAGIG